jgi:hypothetical protein
MSFRLSLLLSACNSAAPTAYIAMKFNTRHFYEYLSNKSKFGQNRAKNWGIYTQAQARFTFLAILNRYKMAFFAVMV